MSYTSLLSDHGWQEKNLFRKDLDLKNMVLWGHISDPEARHTKGLSQYLYNNPDINYLDPNVAKLLVSAVFDEHTYSISMMLGNIFDLPIHWIPLDREYVDFRNSADNNWTKKTVNADYLTHMWFQENGIDIDISEIPRLNQARADKKDDTRLKIRETINQYKDQFPDCYHKIQKNFLQRDIIKYRDAVNTYAWKLGYDSDIMPQIE